MTKQLEQKFKEYDSKNPHVYNTFESFTLQLAKAGVRKTSAWLVVNRMRWESLIDVETDLEYKIPNDFIGIFARRFMKRNPKYSDMFRVKSTKYDLDSLV